MKSRSPYVFYLQAPTLPVSVAIIVVALAISHSAQATMLCSDPAFPVALVDFDSCIVEGSNDDLPSVQAALDLALEPDVFLHGSGSFCPGPGCSGTEFSGLSPGDGFVIDPPTLNSTSFEFQSIPAGTQFVSLKQGNAFQVFKVPGPTPFTLTHDLVGNDTSHISTYVPEPAASALMGLLGLLGLALRRLS